MKLTRVSPTGVMVIVLGCNIVVRKFEFQSFYYVHFRINTLGKDMNSSPTAMS